MEWIHYVGKRYYNIQKFIDESKRLGCARRIDLRVAKGMNWGDEIYVAQWNGSYSILFGCFSVTCLSGLSEEATKLILERFGGKKISDGGRVINRGCGSYVEGRSYAVDITLGELATFLLSLKKENINIGKPLISGTFREIEKIKLIDIPFQQGYRKFDYTKLQKEVDKRFKTWRAKGQFYVEESGEGNKAYNSDGKVQNVISYSQKKV